VKHEVGTYGKDYFQENHPASRRLRQWRLDVLLVEMCTADMRVAAIAGGRPSRIPDRLRAVLSPRDLASGTGQGAPLIL
jgi:hypothetical protein